MFYFPLLIKNSYFGSLKSFAYKKLLSTSLCSLIELSNVFAFPDPEPPIMKIQYR